MTLSDLLFILLLLAAVLVFTATLSLFHRRRLLRSLPSSTESNLSDRIRKHFLVGTDNDLKIELAYLVYATVAILLTHSGPPRPRPPLEFLPAVLALFIGFHFRQSLSKLRLRNLVSLKRLTSDLPIVVKSNSFIGFALTNLLIWYLLYLNPLYALPQLFGLFLHEAVLETAKNKLVLRRRLHLFDLNVFSLDKKTAEIIYRVPGPFGLRRLHALIAEEVDLRRGLALRAFRELITNDQHGFYSLLNENIGAIRIDPDLCYYFGRALYTLGDVDQAEQLLSGGLQKSPDARCAAYLALVALAEIKGDEKASRARTILRPYLEPGPDSPGKMFAHAYFALASALLFDEQSSLTSDPAKDALSHIHHAIRMNERFLAKGDLGRLNYSYYRGNELILMDICGYIIFRLGEPRLAYRILESVIMADNTYPWPYFHIALIYKKKGRASLAQALFTRIAANERTESVIYRLAVKQLKPPPKPCLSGSTVAQ